jgi:hypothetical protein
LLPCSQRRLWRSTGSLIPVSTMRAAQPFARTRPEIPTPPRKTTWPGVAGERGAAGMTDRIRVARAAGLRKDRLSSSGQATTRLAGSEKRRPQGRLPFYPQPPKHDRKNLQRFSENSCFRRRRAKKAGLAKKPRGLRVGKAARRSIRWMMKMSAISDGLPDKPQAALPPGSA